MAGFNLMKKMSGMLLLLLLFMESQRVSTSTEKPKCHELKGNVKLTNTPDICTKVNGILGSNADSVTFNFSQADESTLNIFLANFTEIYGAIIMDGNDKVETLNFGKIRTFYGSKIKPGAMFILIRNNPNLTTIKWDSSVSTFAFLVDAQLNANIKVLIYNNPKLVFTEQDTLKKLDTAVKALPAIQSYIQSTGAKECEFAYPLPMDSPDPSKYITPTAEFLQNCDKIKGDFIVEDVNMTGHAPLQLSGGSCLKLINVDMKNFEFWFAVGSGIAECKDGTRSNITGNPNLCGTEMYKLKQYFKDEFQVRFEADETSCTKSCPPGVVSNAYLFCVSTPTNPATTDPNVPGAAGSGIATPAAPADPVNTTSSPPSSGMEMWKIVVIAAVTSCLAIGGIAAILVLWKKGHLPCCRRGQEGQKDQKKNKDVEKNKKDVEKSGTKTPISSTDTSRSNEKMVSKVVEVKKEEQLKQELEKENEGPKVSEVKKQMKNELEKEKEKSKVVEVKKDKQMKKEPEKGKEESKVSEIKKEKQLKQEPEKEKEESKVVEVKKDKQAKKEPEKGKEESKVSDVKKEEQMKKELEKEKEEPKNKLKKLPPYPLPANFGSYKFNTTVAVQFVSDNIIKSLTAIINEFKSTNYCGAKGDKNELRVDATQRLAMNAENLRRYENLKMRAHLVILLKSGRYVDANLVVFMLMEVEVKFIGTQAPLENTIVDFWQMVFEQKTGNIVQLNKNIEMVTNKETGEREARIKGDPYVPQEKDEEMPFDGVTVVCKETYVAFETVQVSVLKVTIGEETREIKHYHYTAWPDHAIPSSEKDIKVLLDLIELVNLETTNEMGPTVVHCSAGIGRTGVYIMLAMAMKMLNAGIVPDLEVLLGNLRNSRGGAVQTYGQYVFLYDVLFRRIMADGVKVNSENAKQLLEGMAKLMEKINSSTASKGNQSQTSGCKKEGKNKDEDDKKGKVDADGEKGTAAVDAKKGIADVDAKKKNAAAAAK